MPLVAGCSNEAPPAAPREHVTALRGRVTDVAGAPLAGVSVSAEGASAVSRADGRYEIRVAAGDHVVRFSDAAHVDVLARVTVVADSPTQRDATMLAMAAPMPLDSTAGGSVSGMRGAALAAPAGAFVDAATGAPVTGMVDVHLTAVDPSVTAELRGSSGDFTATAAGSRVLLESFGMMDITVEQGGARLQVAPGSELEIHIPVAAGATAPDPTIALWSLDEETGLWTSEGTATYDAATRTYVARTRHMSMWNCDRPALATCVCGRVEERGAGPLPGARVQADGRDYFGSSEATTDATGRFCVAVRKDSDVSIAAYHASGGGEARRVHSGTADTDVPPRMDDPRCLDAGVWTVERDVWRDDSGASLRCEDVRNPFTAGCGTELWSMFECYQPMGACDIHSDGAGGTSITYANGARMVVSGSAAGFTMQMYAPSGALCASATGTTGSSSDFSVTYSSASSGQTFSITIADGGAGDMTLVCPSGERVVVTPEQRQALEACTSSGSSGSGSTSACTYDGAPTPGGSPGGPGTCTSNADCAASPGTICCAVPSAGSYCLSSDVCAMVR